MKIKRNKKSYKWFLCGLILVVVLTISYRVSKANYRISNSIELTTGKVVSSPYDLNIIGLYINSGDGNYIKQEDNVAIPSNGYVINEEMSYCCKTLPCNKDNKNLNVTLKTVAGLHTFSGISKGNKCNIYLDLITINSPTTMNELLQNYYINKKTRLDGTFNQAISGETKNTIYVDADDDGETYYFAGNPQDNWVEFGGYYWRIIRINGDGSIRMIYQGRTEAENGNRLDAELSGENTIIGKSAFNDKNTSCAYVGYWYNDDGVDKPSTIYNFINDWFKNKSGLTNDMYFSKIDKNAGFCGDRK